MEKNTFVHGHGVKAEEDSGGTAENKGIDQSQIRGNLPESCKQEKHQKPGASHQDMVAFLCL